MLNPAGLENADIRRPELHAVSRGSNRRMPAVMSTKLPCNMHEGRGPSMLAFIVAIIVFGLTQVISILVLFRYGMSDNQTLPPSRAAETTSTVGTLIAIAIAASHWLQLGSWW